MRISRTAMLLATATVVLPACGDQHPAAPTPTTTATTAPSGPSGTSAGSVTGYVHDTAWRPVAAARVVVIEGPDTGESAVTDGQGRFSLRIAINEATRLSASAEGHRPATESPRPNCATCVPGHWVYFALEVLAPPVSVEGSYTLTFAADPSCALPGAARLRKYDVRATPSAGRSTTWFDVTVEGGLLLDGYRAASIGVAGDFVAFSLGDSHGTPGIVEQLAPTSYVAFDGWAQGPVGAGTLSAFSAPFDGLVEYCDVATMGVRYACGPGAATRIACASQNHRMILERR